MLLKKPEKGALVYKAHSLIAKIPHYTVIVPFFS